MWGYQASCLQDGRHRTQQVITLNMCFKQPHLLYLLFVLSKSINVDIMLFHRFLCLQNLMTANLVFFKYTAQHPDFSGTGPPYQKPLLNFVWFLLLVIERFVLRSQNMFWIIKETSFQYVENWSHPVAFLGILYFLALRMGYSPSVRSRWLDIGQVLFLRVYGPRRSRGP